MAGKNQVVNFHGPECPCRQLIASESQRGMVTVAEPPKKRGLLASSPLLKPIRQAACQQLSMSGVILHKICRQNISHTNLKSQMQRQKHVSALLALRPFPPASRHGGTHGRRGQAPEGGAGDAGARHDDGHVAEHGRWVRVFHAERGHCLIVIGGSLVLG